MRETKKKRKSDKEYSLVHLILPFQAIKRRKVFKDHSVSKSSTSIRIISSFSFFYACRLSPSPTITFYSFIFVWRVFRKWERKYCEDERKDETETLPLLFRHQLRAVINLCKIFFLFYVIDLYTNNNEVLSWFLHSHGPSAFQMNSERKMMGKVFTGSNNVRSFLTRFPSVEHKKQKAKDIYCDNASGL